MTKNNTKSVRKHTKENDMILKRGKIDMILKRGKISANRLGGKVNKFCRFVVE